MSYFLVVPYHDDLESMQYYMSPEWLPVPPHCYKIVIEENILGKLTYASYHLVMPLVQNVCLGTEGYVNLMNVWQANAQDSHLGFLSTFPKMSWTQLCHSNHYLQLIWYAAYSLWDCTFCWFWTINVSESMNFRNFQSRSGLSIDNG